MQNADRLTYQEIIILNDAVNQNIQHKENDLEILKANQHINAKVVEQQLNQLFQLSAILNNKNGKLFTLSDDFNNLNILINAVTEEIKIIIDRIDENNIQALADIEYITKLAELEKKIYNLISKISNKMNSII